MSNKAVFFDRDGTLIPDPGYINHPDQVSLQDGAAEALKELQLLGYKVVVASNQSGIARGIVSEDMLDRIHERLQEVLGQKGASLDAIYYCPYHPDGVIPKYRRESDWRKPKPGMLLAAADEMEIDLAQSWMVGDSGHDIEAGRSAGCKTILIESTRSEQGPTDKDGPDHVAVNLREAVNLIKKHHRSAQEDQVTTAPPTEDEPVSVARPVAAETQTAEEVPEPPAEAAAAPPGETRPSEGRVEDLLASILEQLKRTHKSEMFGEFSFMRLLAGIVQMFVPFCLLIALWLLMIADGPTGDILVALGFATVLQVMALTFYIMQRGK